MNHTLDRSLSLLFSTLGWFAIIAQLVLMLQNRIAPVGETMIRFFSFFTILTNLIVAIYFTNRFIRGSERKSGLLDKPGSLTAITVYITIVGLVYQFLLRHVWEPTGLQMVVDELLHSVIPLCVIIFWVLFANKEIKWRNIFSWLMYPLVYLIFVLLRGSASGFYPYPFIHVDNLGFGKVILNSAMLMIFFLVLSILFVALGSWLGTKKKI